jgi:hypothetical protein
MIDFQRGMGARLLKSKRLATSTAGRESRPDSALPPKKHPENESFSGRQKTAVRACRPAKPSLIQTVTVGPGISPDRVAVGGSWALPPIGNFTLPRRLIFS